MHPSTRSSASIAGPGAEAATEASRKATSSSSPTSPESVRADLQRTDNAKRLRELEHFRRRFDRSIPNGSSSRLGEAIRGGYRAVHAFSTRSKCSEPSRASAAPIIRSSSASSRAHSRRMRSGWSRRSISTAWRPKKRRRGWSRARLTGARDAVTAIPIAERFSRANRRSRRARRCGLRDDLPTILVLGGGFGMGPLAAIPRVARQRQA